MYCRSSSAPNISEERVRVVFTQPTEDRQKRVQLQPKPIKPWTTGNVGKTKRKKKVKKVCAESVLLFVLGQSL